MKRRCSNPEDRDYHSYGGRGIQVCDRWKDDYDAFVEDMGLRPDGLTLERRDTDKDYSPENCYWATRQQQANNRRTNRIIEGKSGAAKARDLNVSRQAVYTRANKGVPMSVPFRPSEAEHGTISRYTSQKHNCRCSACREAWRVYNQKRKRR
jgi:hypothetical protein